MANEGRVDEGSDWVGHERERARHRDPHDLPPELVPPERKPAERTRRSTGGRIVGNSTMNEDELDARAEKEKTERKLAGGRRGWLTWRPGRTP